MKMKKIIKALMVLTVVSLFVVTSSNAQIVVKIRPNRPRGVVVVRGPRPSPRHVWVSEEWSPNGSEYAYHAGYWAVPPHPRAVWVAGHWSDRRGGSFWVAGHWR